MATTTRVEAGPVLVDGSRLSAEEFEWRYLASPTIRKAELIEGVVHVASPVSDDHGPPHADLVQWVGFYRVATPFLIASIEGTIRLDNRNQPQPDVHLRIASGNGGQATRSADGYVEGAPELVAEIAVSSKALDLGARLEAYRRNLVREYLVWRVEDRAIDWFILRDGRYDRIALSEDGTLRSKMFPGLWLAPDALIRGDLAAVFATVQRGLATAEHAAFVERLGRATPP